MNIYFWLAFWYIVAVAVYVVRMLYKTRDVTDEELEELYDDFYIGTRTMVDRHNKEDE